MRNQITYLDYSFADVKISKATIGAEQSLPMSTLGIDTLEADVKCTDASIVIFTQNTPINVYRRGRHRGIYFLQDITRIGPDRYTLSAISSVGRLEQSLYYGGVYNGILAEELIRDICGEIPVQVKSSLQNIAVYGYLPILSRRMALAQVLFAISAYLSTDRNGALRVESLYRGLSGTVDADHVYTGGKVVYDKPVTSVTVLEHQYVAGGDETHLFEGTTVDGQRITFEAPMSDLVADGFEIIDSDANYAIVTAGAGTLTGRAYIHTTREITRTVQAAPVPAEKRVEDATLVTLVNSNAIADRLAEYFACAVTIQQETSSDTLRPGQVVKMFDPFDRKMVQGTVQAMNTNTSATLRSDTSLLVGFAPPESGEKAYYNYRELVTEDTEWKPPAGTTEVTAILIGCGTDGENGMPGFSSVITTKTTDSASASWPGRDAGPGGKGGAGGKGGFVFRALVSEISSEDIFSIKIGTKSNGGTTIFGSFSSDIGSQIDSGYVDPVTGDVFAKKGMDGHDGGNGGSAGEFGDSVEGWSGGMYASAAQKTSSSTGGKANASFGSAGGGGAAYGSDGSNARSSSVVSAVGSYVDTANKTMRSFYARTRPFYGGRGAPGANGKDASMPGSGGDGGHGGGGAGACGSLSLSISLESGWRVLSSPGYTCGNDGAWAEGGDGGKGGAGADGCVILYYSVPKNIASGAVLDRTGCFLADRTGRRIVV